MISESEDSSMISPLTTRSHFQKHKKHQSIDNKIHFNPSTLDHLTALYTQKSTLPEKTQLKATLLQDATYELSRMAQGKRARPRREPAPLKVDRLITLNTLKEK
jgi:hypothetical protein